MSDAMTDPTANPDDTEMSDTADISPTSLPVQGEPIEHTNAPASFNVLLNNLRSLALDVEVKLEEEA